jgi:hypothetical protein
MRETHVAAATGSGKEREKERDMSPTAHRFALLMAIVIGGSNTTFAQGVGGTTGGPNSAAVGATGGASATQSPSGTAAPPANPATPPGGPVTTFPGTATSSVIQPTPGLPSGQPDATLSTRIGPNGFPCGTPATGGPSVAISPNNSGAARPPTTTGQNLNPSGASDQAC